MHNTKKMVGVGILAAAAAVAAYAFTGERGKRNRKRVASWARRMESEVVTKLKEMQVVTQEKYDEVIDVLKKKYQAMRDLDPEAVALAALQLKKHWPAIKESLYPERFAKQKTAKPKQRKTKTK